MPFIPQAKGFFPRTPSLVQPDQLAGLAAWYKEDGHVELTTPGVAYQWIDASGNGRHFYQPLTIFRPAIVPGALNGLDAVQGDGVDDFMSLVAPLALTDFTVFVVAKQDALTTAGAVAYLLGNAGSRGIWSDADNINAGPGAYQTTFRAAAAGYRSDDYRVALLKNAKIFINGAEVSYLGGSSDVDAFTLELLFCTGAVSFAGVTLCEMAVYSRQLTDVECAQLATYAASKWGPF